MGGHGGRLVEVSLCGRRVCPHGGLQRGEQVEPPVRLLPLAGYW
jgi:hypothetical protein